ALIRSEDGAVDDAGVIFGHGGVFPAMRGWDALSDGYAGSLACAREVSAITGACALIRRDQLERLGCFPPAFQSSRFAWLDPSFRALSEGLRTVVPPQSVAVRCATPAEPISALDDLLLSDVWHEVLVGKDPYDTELLGRSHPTRVG